MARRVGNREGRESGGVVTGNAHINKEKAFTEEKCARCEELQRAVQKLEEEKQELSGKCSSKSEKIRDLEAHMTVVKENNKKLTQELKQKEGYIKSLTQELNHKEGENKRLKFTPTNVGQIWSELQQKTAEIADMQAKACCKISCKDNELELQTLKQQLTRILNEPCTRPDCGKMRSEKAASELELSQLTSEPCTKMKCREILSKNTELTTQHSQLTVELTKSQQEATALKEKLNEVVGRQEEQAKFKQDEKWLRAELQQKTEALDERRNRQESLELKNEKLTKDVKRLNTELEQTMKALDECKNQQERLRAELQLKEEALANEYKQLQERLKSERKKESERLQFDFEQRKIKVEEDYRSERQRCQSELEENKKEQEKKLQSEVKQVINNNKEQLEKMQSEKDQLAREIERLNALTCKGKDCPSHYLQTVRSDISGRVEDSQTGERVSLRDLIVSLGASVREELQQLQWSQQQSCAACLEKESLLQNSEEVHCQLQTHNQKCQDVIRRHEKTIHDLKRQLYSEPCQRQECAKLRKEMRQNEMRQMGDPGKDMDKQRVVEHDPLIHEFERLTTDPDGLLGVLEDTLHEYGDEANFEAKRLLCALFQESYDNCKKAVIRAVCTQLQLLFAVQPTKSEEIEDASRGYGLLLSAFGLRTDKIRGQHCAKIKEKMQNDTSSDETLHKVKETLESSREDHLGKVIALTWKFVTLPNPLVVYQPKKFDSQIHEPQYGRWDKHAKESELIYLRPVVCRNYEGVVASKGWVANTSQHRGGKCVLS